MPRALSYVFGLVAVALLGAGGYFAYQLYTEWNQQGQPVDQATGQPINPNTGKPAGRLVVLVVFDQMRGDYIARWAEAFGSGGFKRVEREGVWFSSVEIPYACTSTGPGHASIATGAPPSVTGIIENEWFSRKAGEDVYCVQPLDRPYELVPPIAATDAKASRGSSLGFSPERLLAQTVGDKLKAVTGDKSKVVSLSIKDRTAVLMGGKKPDAVYCFDTRDGKFHTDTHYAEKVAPWVEEFNASSITKQWFGKPWERFRADLNYQSLTGNPDEAPGEDLGVSQGLKFPHPMNGGLKAIGPKYYEALETSPYGNELLFDLVKKAIAAEKLGTSGTTDLLCVSFSSNDLIGHRWGPDSWEVLDITLRSDKLIAEFLTYLDVNLGPDRYSMVITADHGVSPLPEQDKTKEKYPAAERVKLNDQPNELLGRLNMALEHTFGPAPGGPTRWFEARNAKEQERVWPWFYLNYRDLEKRGLNVQQVATYVRDWLQGQPFIATAFTQKQLETESFEPGSTGAKVKLAFYPDRCGDVIAIPKPGVLVTSYNSGTNHGTPNAYDSHVPVLAIGHGIPATGKRAEKVSSLIVAPIVAHALGIERPANATEKVPAELERAVNK